MSTDTETAKRVVFTPRNNQPGAYKPIEDIIGPIAESVDIIDVIRPIYNFKAS